MALDLRQLFISELGESEWDESRESFMNIDPEFFKASVRLKAVPTKSRHLPPKIQALISLTVNANATHMYKPGVTADIKRAITAGATVSEIKETIQLASTLGIHACNVGVPTLIEVMREEGLYNNHPTAGKPFDAQRRSLQFEFTEKRGYWHAFWGEFLALDPEFFAAYTEFSAIPWLKEEDDASHSGTLEPMVKELMYCAFDGAATHLYRPGLKEHMRNALRYGATVEQILEVLEIATQLSVHTANLAYSSLAQVLRNNE